MFVQTKVDTLVRLNRIAKTVEATRFYLMGVHVRSARAGGIIAEATNGHIMGVEHDFTGAVDGDPIVRLELIDAIAKAAKAVLKAHRSVAYKDLRVHIEARHFAFLTHTKDGTQALSEAVAFNALTVAPNAFVDGQYPDCQRVVPSLPADTPHGTKAGFNAAYLDLLARSAVTKDQPKSASFPFVLYHAGDCTGPALMRVCGAPDWLGVIMPMRVDSAATSVRPSWFYGEAQVAPKAARKPRKAPVKTAAKAPAGAEGHAAH